MFFVMSTIVVVKVWGSVCLIFCDLLCEICICQGAVRLRAFVFVCESVCVHDCMFCVHVSMRVCLSVSV